jgi:transcriptional regulator with XRE-family HTH domain
MEELSKIIGEHMKSIRNKKQLTISTVSKKTGISIANLSLYENGKKGASIPVLYKWCCGLNVKLSAPFRR